MKLAIVINSPELTHDVHLLMRMCKTLAHEKPHDVHQANLSTQPVYPFVKEIGERHEHWAKKMFQHMVGCNKARYFGIASVKFKNLCGVGYYVNGALVTVLVPDNRAGKTFGLFVCRTPTVALDYLMRICASYETLGGKPSNTWTELDFTAFGKMSTDIYCFGKYNGLDWRIDLSQYQGEQILVTTGEYLDPAPWTTPAIVGELRVTKASDGSFSLSPHEKSTLPGRVHEHLTLENMHPCKETIGMIDELGTLLSDYIALQKRAADFLGKNFPRWKKVDDHE